MKKTITIILVILMLMINISSVSAGGEQYVTLEMQEHALQLAGSKAARMYTNGVATYKLWVAQQVDHQFMVNGSSMECRHSTTYAWIKADEYNWNFTTLQWEWHTTVSATTMSSSSWSTHEILNYSTKEVIYPVTLLQTQPIVIIRPEATVAEKPTEIEFTITDLWPTDTGLHLVQKHINGTEIFLKSIEPFQVQMYKDYGISMTVLLSDIQPGQTTFKFYKTNEGGGLPPSPLVYEYTIDYTGTAPVITGGYTVQPKIKLYRDIESNADTSKIYVLLTDYYAKFNGTGKTVPGKLMIQATTTYNGVSKVEEKTFNYPTGNILKNWYYGAFGLPDARFYSFTQRLYYDTDSQHNALNDIAIRIRFFPEGNTKYIQHNYVIPTSYNSTLEGRDWFLQKQIDTDNTTATPEGNWEVPTTDQTRQGYTPVTGLGSYVDEGTQRMLEKLSIGPLQETFEKLLVFTTEQGTAPVFKINLGSLLGSGQRIHGNDGTGVFAEEASGTTFIDFAILENYSFAGFTIIGLSRALMTFGMIYMTLIYIWRKVEDVSAS